MGLMPKEPMKSRVIRVSESVWQAAHRRAEERGETVSEVVRQFLEKYEEIPARRSPRQFADIFVADIERETTACGHEGCPGDPTLEAMVAVAIIDGRPFVFNASGSPEQTVETLQSAVDAMKGAMAAERTAEDLALTLAEAHRTSRIKRGGVGV